MDKICSAIRVALLYWLSRDLSPEARIRDSSSIDELSIIPFENNNAS